MGQGTGLDARWKALAARDAAADGTFVFAVTSTGVYCRPSCPSRRPRADRVRFFDTAAAARAEGFRPCKRCRPDQVDLGAPGMDAVRRVTAYLAANADRSITLARLGRVAAMSPSHLQRRFKALVGVSPRQYQAACRAGTLRRALRGGSDVTTAIVAAGYGSPSRVYETRAAGMRPSAYRRGGAGMRIAFSTVACEHGRLLVATTEHGVCAVRLGDSDAALERELRDEYPAAEIRPDQPARTDWLDAIVQHVRGASPSIDLAIDVQATAFQWQVWRALQRIPYGETRAYGEIARSLGHPRAARAVARACATNPVGLVIPCHRVVQGNGELGGYRWGVERKKALLAREREASTASREKSTRSRR
ncbi:MAG: bifunctional DNA-binding transcriptional regulator/O6-methylguanine-DNA methyltransferase Ada [Acidobacteria bacterium]|nr:bifunctional DNA-binding transcriptional regulator/O6-methylguanine-DNA methyltransferase Ada [Acidobacteriota bacterium]